MVNISFIYVDDECRYYDKCLPLLLPDRKKKAETLVNKMDRYISMLSSLLIYKCVLKDEILFDENGKPYIPNYLKFNITHTKGIIAIAVSQKEVGIDIENASRSVDERLSKMFLNDGENSYSPIQTWTIKESIIKCLGTGLRCNLKNVPLPKEFGKAYQYQNTNLISESKMLDNNYFLSLTYESDALEEVTVEELDIEYLLED